MLSNTVGPRFPLELLKDTAAFDSFSRDRKSKKLPRLYAGDTLCQSLRQRFARCPAGQCMIGFKSIFQGDHAGVEIATSAHEGLLQSVGLLDEHSRIQSGRPFLGSTLCEGLVIYDSFAIARVPKRPCS